MLTMPNYRALAQLGRDAFVASVAPTLLVRRGDPGELFDPGVSTLQFDRPTVPTGAAPRGEFVPAVEGLAWMGLVKKPGAPFPDRVTVGRTADNDLVLGHHTVSRLHAFFRLRDGHWWVADANSKNGTVVMGKRLVAGEERVAPVGAELYLGDVALCLWSADQLFDALRGGATAASAHC